MPAQCKLHLVLVLVLFFAFLVTTRTDKTIKLTNIECQPLDPKYFAVRVCRMKAINRNITEVTVHVSAFQLPIDNVTVAVKILHLGYDNKRPIMDFQVDACKFFRNKRRNILAELLYRAIGLDKYSNMNHSCPFNDSLLKLEKYRFQGMAVASFLPVPMGKYKLWTLWSMYNKPRLVATVNFHIF